MQIIYRCYEYIFYTCRADVPEKIVHPINYGYFSKTQPRQRFFLDTDSLAVTNQCIYLTLNKLSSHYDAEQCPPLIYFLTLLNSTTLQFFVLHHCQYDQQGRMRLFRESMAKIPFQDRDVKNHPERIQYVAQLGACMIELKDVLYSVVAGWRLTGSHHSSSSAASQSSIASGRRGSTGGLASVALYPTTTTSTSTASVAPTSTGGSSNQGLLDWIRKGGNPPLGLLSRIKDQVRRMLVAQANSHPHARHPSYQPPGPVASSAARKGGAVHVTKTRSSSSAPSSIPHLNKPHNFKAGAMIGSVGAAFFTDTDTDTNTFTDTDTDTDDTMDPWMGSRFEGKMSNRIMPRGVGSTATSAVYQNQSNNRSQGQHSLARILNMTGDDGETSMDDEEEGGGSSSMTDGPLSTMPVPIPDGGSRDHHHRASFRSGVSAFGQVGNFGEEANKKTGPVSTTTAMETDLDEFYHNLPSGTTSASSSRQQQQHHQVGGASFSTSSDQHQISIESDCNRILQAIERAVTMVDMVQWAVDQYGYMLYGIRPKFQKLLELELKIVYGTRLESLILPTTPPLSAPGFRSGEDSAQAVAASLGITVWDLYRWEGDSEPMPPLLHPAPASNSKSATSPLSGSVPGGRSSDSGSGGGSGRQLLPTYAFQVLENAQSATQLLREIIAQFPALPSPSTASVV